MNNMTQLSDQADVHIYPVSPALNAEDIETIARALDKLLVQFLQEDVIDNAASEITFDGAVIVVAYDRLPSAEDLSGCRKSKITALFSHYEQQLGITILSTPPMIICYQDQWQCFDRSKLKPLVKNGDIELTSIACNTRAENLGAWRTNPSLAIQDMWMEPIVTRMMQ
ncbi:MAG: hypothetical protein HRU15_14990 [Planctomycetes bacterium]|nr:hypothetical protein [Planctomycetota bacterium]